MNGAQASVRAVDVRHLTRRFGSVAAVNDLTLAVRSGEIYGLLGSNGAGKTTLISDAAGSWEA